MSARAFRKIASYILGFLLLYALGLFAWVGLPFPWGLPVTFVWFLLFAGIALYLLDMTVPGVGLFSPAPTRLPPGETDAVALTFDDGPVEPYTRQILDVLDRAGAKGTFFCLGENVDRFPNLAREIVKRGHTIANHTYGHRILPFLSEKALKSEIEKGGEAIFRVTGVRPSLFRCTKGYKSPRVARAVAESGARLVGFSYPIFDVQNPPPEVLVGRVLRRVRPGDILLMHDGFAPRAPGKRDSLVTALPEILDGITRKGLRTVTLDRIFSTGPSTER